MSITARAIRLSAVVSAMACVAVVPAGALGASAPSMHHAMKHNCNTHSMHHSMKHCMKHHAMKHGK